MNSLSVIIPSRNHENLIPCVEAVRRHEPNAHLTIVDDGLEWPDSLNDYEVVQGANPFIFARNCNIGIKANGGFDVVLLNDDALLESPGGFSLMQEAAAADPSLGLISATTNLASNPHQKRRRPHFGMRLARPGTAGDRRYPCVAFVCVLIPARTIERVGLLDERFTSYGWEDVDYCRRVHEAGLKIGIDDRCFVDHSKLPSTFRGDPKAPGPIDEGRRIYEAKWGKV